jgi:hypothetical protein
MNEECGVTLSLTDAFHAPDVEPPARSVLRRRSQERPVALGAGREAA